MAETQAPKIKNHKVAGNLATDPKVIETGNRSMVVFRLAENHRTFDRESSQWVDTGTTYYDVAIPQSRQDLSQNVLASLREGHRVLVSGTYDVKPYVATNGTAGLNHRLMAQEVAALLDFNQVRIGPNASTVAASAAPAAAQASSDPWMEGSAGAQPDTDFNAAM